MNSDTNEKKTTLILLIRSMKQLMSFYQFEPTKVDYTYLSFNLGDLFLQICSKHCAMKLKSKRMPENSKILTKQRPSFLQLTQLWKYHVKLRKAQETVSIFLTSKELWCWNIHGISLKRIKTIHVALSKRNKWYHRTQKELYSSSKMHIFTHIR